MSKTAENRPVVWITSYPKAGNTWVQNVVRNAGKSFGVPQEDLDVYKLLREDRDVSFGDAVRTDVCEKRTAILKTHEEWSDGASLHPSLKLTAVGFVHIMRNPLDVLLSFINFTRLQYQKNKNNAIYQERLFKDFLGYNELVPYEKWRFVELEDIPQRNFDHALTVFANNGTYLPNIGGKSWIGHNLTWTAAKDSLPSIFLRYEDLVRDYKSFNKLSQIFRFDDDQIQDAVQAVNRRMAARENSNIFFNKMSAYYYMRFFSRSAIDYFLDNWEEELTLLGYDQLPRDE